MSGTAIGVRHRGGPGGTLYDITWYIKLNGNLSLGAPGGCTVSADCVGSIPGGGVASDFHTYRGTRDGDGFRLYIDNDPISVLGLGIPVTGGFGDMHIGWEVWGGDGVLEFDYFRATNTGAHPAPEPTTLALLSLGALALLRRRR